MKKLLAASTLALATLTNTAYANNELKIKTIKQVYAHASKTNDNSIPHKYATPNFIKQLKRVDKVTQKDIDEGLGIECYEMSPRLLYADWEIAKTQKRYSINKQGQVVVHLKYGNKSYNGTEIYRFNLQCTKNQCLIDDVISEFGSGRKNIEDSCPK